MGGLGFLAVVFLVPFQGSLMGYLSSAPSDFLHELPLSTAFDVFVFQSPEAGLTGLGVFCPPGRVCESVDRAGPVFGW